MSVPPRIETTIRPLQVLNPPLACEKHVGSRGMQVFAQCDPLALLGGDARDWLTRLVSLAEQLSGVAPVTAAATSELEHEARWLTALTALPREGLPPFALAQVRPLPADTPLVCSVAPALALVLLAQSGGSVFSRLRAPTVPDRAWLSRRYVWLAYSTPAREVGHAG